MLSAGQMEDKENEIAWNSFFYKTTNGLILELGAKDGAASGSVSGFFETVANWKAILIEGSPSSATKILTNRPEAMAFNVAICDTPKKVHYLQGIDDSVSGVAEMMTQGVLQIYFPKVLTEGKLDLHKMPMAGNMTLKDIQVASVDCLPLTHILGPLEISHINFFMLDVEGGEMTVLEAIDFGKITFDVIAVETARKADAKLVGLTDQIIEKVTKFLSSKGYVLSSWRNGRNTWFVSKSFKPSIRN